MDSNDSVQESLQPHRVVHTARDGILLHMDKLSGKVQLVIGKANSLIEVLSSPLLSRCHDTNRLNPVSQEKHSPRRSSRQRRQPDRDHINCYST
ncbi:hypothetical protein ScPMuIL_002706 [Solemya velum]